MLGNKLNQEIEDSILGNDIIDSGINIAEVGLDVILEGEVLKEIPIIKTLYSLIKTGINIKEAIFIKKLLLFLNDVETIPHDKRDSFIKSISKEIDKKERLFEKIINSIDKLDDSKKCYLLSKAFRHLVNGELTLIEFYKLSRVIDELLFDEIEYFFIRFSPPENPDKVRDKREYYMRAIEMADLNAVLEKTGLLVITSEVKTNDRISPGKITLEESRSLTKLGRLFADFGYTPRYVLKSKKQV